MCAGKTPLAIMMRFNYHSRGRRTIFFAPACDTRIVGSRTTTKIGVSAPVVLFLQDDDLYLRAQKEDLSYNDGEPAERGLDLVIVDEAQFLTEKQVWQLSDVVDKMAVDVVAFGLRTDFLGRLFCGSEALLALADEVVEIPAICSCGQPAKMHLRVDAAGTVVRQGEVVQIGSSESYMSVCRKCFKKGMGR